MHSEVNRGTEEDNYRSSWSPGSSPRSLGICGYSSPGVVEAYKDHSGVIADHSGIVDILPGLVSRHGF